MRRDDDDQFGAHTTGSLQLRLRLAVRRAPRGHVRTGLPRADLLRPLRTDVPRLHAEPGPAARASRRPTSSRCEASPPRAPVAPHAFDNRFDNLIVYSFTRGHGAQRRACARARHRGRGRDAVAGRALARRPSPRSARRTRTRAAMLQGRAERFGTFEVNRGLGPFTAGMIVLASERALRFHRTRIRPRAWAATRSSMRACATRSTSTGRRSSPPRTSPTSATRPPWDITRRDAGSCSP